MAKRREGRTLIVALALACALSPVPALDPSKSLSQFAVDVWKTGDGLPESAIPALAQTSDGYLWIGTQGGLARFDGVRFTVFDKRNTGALVHDDVTCLLADSRGALWIGTGSALYRWSAGRFEAVDLGGEGPHAITALFEDRGARVWVGAADQPLRVVRSGTVEVHRDAEGTTLRGVTSIGERFDGEMCFAAGDVSCLTDGRFVRLHTDQILSTRRVVSRLAAARDGLWMGTSGDGLGRLGPAGVLRLDTNSGLAHGFVFSVVAGAGGVVWAGSGGGLARIRDGVVDLLTVEGGLPHNVVLSLLEDHEGSLWMGTQGGLARLRETRFETTSVREGLLAPYVHAMLEDRSGAMWFATANSGLQRRTDGTWETFGRGKGIEYDVLSLWEGSNGGLWAGTAGGGVLRLDGDRFVVHEDRAKVVLAGLTDPDGTVWVGGLDGLFRVGNDSARTLRRIGDFPRVSSIQRGPDGAVWAASFGGLLRFQADEVRHFTTADGLASDRVLDLHIDTDGVLWLATYGGGLVRVKDGAFHAITSAAGLPDDELYSVVEDDHGRLWLGTARGVIAVDKRACGAVADGVASAVEPMAFGVPDGMRDAECTGGYQPAGWKSRDGRIWFATVDGAVAVDPARLTPNSQPPPVSVERVVADRREFDPLGAAGGIVVPPGDRDLELHYTALSFIGSESIRFRYRLEGFDEDWVDAGVRRAAYYTNLPPGRFVFRVTAASSDGVWNESGATLALRLEPRFHETWPFFALVFLAVSGLLYGAHRYRLSRIVELERVRTRIATDLHDDIGSSLSRISILSELTRRKIEESAADAAALVGEIGETARELVRATSDIVWAVDPRRDDLGSLMARLRAFASDVLETRGISLEFEGPQELGRVRLAPEARRHLFLILKEAINNVARHAGASSVSVAVHAAEGMAAAEVRDDGCGFSTRASHEGHGLSNMRSRAEAIGGTVEIDSSPGRGTRVGVRVPLR